MTIGRWMLYGVHLVSICPLPYVVHMENICKPYGYFIWKPDGVSGANHIKYHMIPIWHSHMCCIWASYNNAIGVYAVLQFYCKYRLPGCARRPQYRETSIAFFSDSPLTEINHFCSKRLISGLSFKQNMLYFAGFGRYTVVVKARTSSYPVG